MKSAYAALDYTAAVLLGIVAVAFALAMLPVVVAVDIYRLARKQ